MTGPVPSTLVVGLGNDILGDDAVGLLAARCLRRQFPDLEVVEAGSGGLELLDLLAGWDCALLLDAVLTGRHPAGTLLEFSRQDFHQIVGPSPHYAGLPEMLRLAECLAIPMPAELCVLAMEVEDPYCVREGISPSVANALPAYVRRGEEILRSWRRGSRGPGVGCFQVTNADRTTHSGPGAGQPGPPR